MHPVLVLIAWRKLYRTWPTFWEMVAIVIHDWGYFGKPNMDGPEGESHPIWAYRWLLKRDRYEEANQCLFHSRFFAKKEGRIPSELCFADKLANALVPAKLYVLMTEATGELKEYLEATKHESVRHSTNSEDFVLRFRGVVRLVLLNSQYEEVRDYAENRWTIRYVVCHDKLNA
jgi:hypothetical protein